MSRSERSKEAAARALLFAAHFAAGCTVPGIDVSDRTCPCAPGWYCHDDDRCHPTPPPDGGSAVPLCDQGHDTVFCSGMEGEFGAGWTGESVSLAEVAYTTERAHRGASAFEIRTAAPRGYGYLGYDTLAFPPNGGWLRFHAYLDGDDTHSWIALAYVSRVVRGIAVIVLDGELAIEMGDDDITIPSGVPAPTDRWMCVELFVAENGGRSELYLDGARIAALPAGPTEPDLYTGLSIGVQRTDDNQPAVRVLIDEVAVSAARIPCP